MKILELLAEAGLDVVLGGFVGCCLVHVVAVIVSVFRAMSGNRTGQRQRFIVRSLSAGAITLCLGVFCNVAAELWLIPTWWHRGLFYVTGVLSVAWLLADAVRQFCYQARFDD